VKKISIICKSCNYLFETMAEISEEIEELTCSQCGRTNRYLPHKIKAGREYYQEIWSAKTKKE